jgi:hypothetical protein
MESSVDVASRRPKVYFDTFGNPGEVVQLALQ